MGQEESATLTREGLLAYANNDMKQASPPCGKAYYKGSPERTSLSLLNKIEAEATMEKDRTAQGPSSFLRSIKKVFDARQAILEGAMTWPSKNARTSWI